MGFLVFACISRILVLLNKKGKKEMIRKHLCCVASVKVFIQISYKKDPNYKQTVCLVHFVVHSVESMPEQA